MLVSSIEDDSFFSLLNKAGGEAIEVVTFDLNLPEYMSVADQAIVELVASPSYSNSHFVYELNFLEEVADKERSFQLEIL